jgi:acetoin utilization protein AcuB
MTRSVITVDKEDRMIDAMLLLKQHNIHRLPVMEKDRLVGIVSDKDIIKTSVPGVPSLEMIDALYRISKIRVEEIMTKNPITIPADYTVDEAAEILLEHKISGAPVMNNQGEMVGIITTTDLLKVKTELAGIEKRGISFAFQLKDHPGAVKSVADIIRKYGGQIASVQCSYENVPDCFREVYIRMYGIDPERFKELRKKLEQKVELLYMVDHSENRRVYYRTGEI